MDINGPGKHLQEVMETQFQCSVCAVYSKIFILHCNNCDRMISEYRKYCRYHHSVYLVKLNNSIVN